MTTCRSGITALLLVGIAFIALAGGNYEKGYLGPSNYAWFPSPMNVEVDRGGGSKDWASDHAAIHASVVSDRGQRETQGLSLGSASCR